MEPLSLPPKSQSNTISNKRVSLDPLDEAVEAKSPKKLVGGPKTNGIIDPVINPYNTMTVKETPSANAVKLEKNGVQDLIALAPEASKEDETEKSGPTQQPSVSVSSEAKVVDLMTRVAAEPALDGDALKSRGESSPAVPFHQDSSSPLCEDVKEVLSESSMDNGTAILTQNQKQWDQIVTIDEKEDESDDNFVDVADDDVPADRQTSQNEKDMIVFFKSQLPGTSSESQEELEKELCGLRDKMNQQKSISKSITEQIYEDCKELLELFGLPYIIAASEAEAQCAWLEQKGMTHGTITDDSDIWLFGGQKVYKDVFNQSRHVMMFTLNDMEKHLKLSRERLCLLAMLTGCDYTDGLKGIGTVGGLEIISEFWNENDQGTASLTRFRDWYNEESGKMFPKNSLSKPRQRIRKMKLDLPEDFPNQEIFKAFFQPMCAEYDGRPSWTSVPKLEVVREFACKRLFWTVDKTDQMLLPAIKKWTSKQNQTLLTNFLVSIRKEPPKQTKRVREAVKKLKNDGSADDITVPKTEAKKKPVRKAVSNSTRKGPNSTSEPKDNSRRKRVSKTKAKGKLKEEDDVIVLE